MKAIAVFPGKADSIHLTELPMPKLEDIPNGRGVLVKVLRVGVDGTDKEINDAEYGAAPKGYDFLVTGHESFGIVEAVGNSVTGLAPGDFVTATVRRPGKSVYDRIGAYDMTTDDVYYERGINLLHGYLTEYYVDEPEYIVKVPNGLKEFGVLLEPSSVVEKGISQAFEIQRRLKVWSPERAAVLGAGTIGLLAALALRIRGLEVCVFARTRPPYLNSGLVGEIGGRYFSLQDATLAEASKAHGPFDLIFEATGYAPLVFDAMNVLAKNGVLILSSVTGGGRKVEVPADQINLGFVLGNKVMLGTVNANREHFESGVKDFSFTELEWPGWLKKLLTHPVKGLENYRTLMQSLTDAKGAIKVFCDVAPFP
ncbi:MAG: glucose dehydrogenase [Elusimicrobia bacterium RIFCSPHIGHO2_01_FULL_64_10]|nr:MAG: glucose dehydrogenase [Elusimicrobia bacterium RIFCSPHIGHO2_01_FULL_64_10]